MSDMGIGEVGKQGTIIKRKFRWTLEITWPGGFIPKNFVKLAARPKLSIDTTEINFLNATTWLPGKAKWEPINVTYIDAAHKDMGGLYDWIATLYNFQDDMALGMSEKSGWSGTGVLTMYDGCGSPLETWTMKSMWPESVDFGEVDYASSDEMNIELTLRYSEVKHQGMCGTPSANGTCKGC